MEMKPRTRTRRRFVLVLAAGLFALLITACGETGQKITNCSSPYVATVGHHQTVSGCAGTIGPNAPTLTIHVGERFSVRITHERNGTLDFPLPTSSNSVVARRGRRGATLYYQGVQIGQGALLSRDSKLCAGHDPRQGSCVAFHDRVIAG